MKRALPLLLLVLALAGVAIGLLNSGGDGPGTQLEPAPVAQGPSQRPADPLPLQDEEELGALPASAERRDAGDAAQDSAGMAGVETRSLEGWLTLPFGAPADPSLRVVTISINGVDADQGFTAVIGHTDIVIGDQRKPAPFDPGDLGSGIFSTC